MEYMWPVKKKELSWRPCYNSLKVFRLWHFWWCNKRDDFPEMQIETQTLRPNLFRFSAGSWWLFRGPTTTDHPTQRIGPPGKKLSGYSLDPISPSPKQTSQTRTTNEVWSLIFRMDLCPFHVLQSSSTPGGPSEAPASLSWCSSKASTTRVSGIFRRREVGRKAALVEWMSWEGHRCSNTRTY